MDRLSHACMIDGVRLSGAQLRRFQHNDMEHLEALLRAHRPKARHCIILTETIFSMDGDAAPLDALSALATQYDAWLMTDDAHGFGIVNHPNPALVQMGTLSKAAGCYGGYVCGSRSFIDMLKNHARTVMFSTALSEVMLHATADALQCIQEEPQRREQVKRHVEYLCDAFHLPRSPSAIVPFVLGDNDTVLRAHYHLKKCGVFVPAIRPPTVPKGTARLRICVNALHQQEHLDELINAIKSFTRTC